MLAQVDQICPYKDCEFFIICESTDPVDEPSRAIKLLQKHLTGWTKHFTKQHSEPFGQKVVSFQASAAGKRFVDHLPWQTEGPKAIAPVAFDFESGSEEGGKQSPARMSLD